MKTYQFAIHLRSDAEPSSGLGGEMLNSLLPRNEHGKVTIPASHLKGLMRESLYNLLNPLRKDTAAICSYLFGRPGEEGDGGQPGIIHVTGAVATGEAKIITVTRTRIGEDGRAADTSLRTGEALSVGSVLKGSLRCGTDDPELLKLCRLSLLSIFELGGGRTRGAGACRIVITGYESETPGKLLHETIGAELKTGSAKAVYTETGDAGTGYRALKLYFRADSPMCLPERPHGKNNVIGSGFQIPGTAIAGTLLNLISESDPELSSACFRSSQFRCYPLLPLMDTEECLLPVLVSNSHKISKIPQDGGNYLFGDQMIPDEYLEEDYRWQQKTAGISMKGTNGVLIVHDDKSVELLKNSDIPRYYTAHGVVNGTGDKKDNLFTMESVFVKNYSGLVIVPEKAADHLLGILKAGRQVFFGKAKSTMGSGTLTAEEWPVFQKMENDFPQVKQLKNRLFIVQTPIVYDAAAETGTLEVVNQVLGEAGWGEAEAESVMTGVLFGWNSLGLAEQVNRTGRVKAKRVILPGSVFLLKEPLSGLSEKLAAGLGKDRYAGYGGVIPHPMFASRLYKAAAEIKTEAGVSGRKSPVYCGYELDKICEQKLSASQISMLWDCVQISRNKAEEFLDTQKKSRPKRIWDQWSEADRKLREYLKSYTAEEMTEMIRVWHDLRVGRN